MSIDSEADGGVFYYPGEDVLVHEWRREQLQLLGVPQILVECLADDVDWHTIADLVGRGCPPRLAVEIAR